MTCQEAGPLLGAYLDSELDLTAALSVERHLASCSGCSRDLENLERLREELSPAVLNRIDASGLERLRAHVRHLTRPRTGEGWRKWKQPALWTAIAAAVVLVVVLPMQRGDGNSDRELVDSHIRSLMANHLVDVPSSDQHTVKPWFQGKVDFAPDVPDLTDKGYELMGGRLDILGGRPAAALVYKHGRHFVNLWTARAETGGSEVRYSAVDGYQVAHWTAAGLDKAAVTDMNRGELLRFVRLFREQ